MDNWSYKSIVYAIRHNLSNRVYVGCTFCNGRIERHLRLLANGKHPVPLMQKDCDDLGFTYSAFVLEECDEDCRMDRERYWILKLKSFNPDYGYNYRDNRFIPPRDIDLDTFESYRIDGRYLVQDDDGFIEIDDEEFTKQTRRKEDGD